MAGYYDYVLVFIPTVLAAVTAGLTVFGVGLSTAVPLGAVAAVPLIGHAMFVRTPETEALGPRTSAARSRTGDSPQAAD